MPFTWRCIRPALIALLLCLTTEPLARAAEGEDLDAYTFRTTAVWWFSQPTGSFTGKANSGTFDLSRDFGFGNYSTLSGTTDWRYKRKHHFLFGISPVTNSRRVTLSRTIEYQGVTYQVGTEASADIKCLLLPQATNTTSYGGTAYRCGSPSRLSS